MSHVLFLTLLSSVVLIKISVSFEFSAIGSGIDVQVDSLCRYLQPNTQTVESLITSYTNGSKPIQFATAPVQILRGIFVENVEGLYNYNIESSAQAFANLIGPPLQQRVSNIPKCIKEIPIDEFNETISNLDQCINGALEDVVSNILEITSSVRKLIDSFCNSWNNNSSNATSQNLIAKASNITKFEGATLKLYSDQTSQSFSTFVSQVSNVSSCIYTNGTDKLARELAVTYRTFLNCLGK